MFSSLVVHSPSLSESLSPSLLSRMIPVVVTLARRQPFKDMLSTFCLFPLLKVTYCDSILE